LLVLLQQGHHGELTVERFIEKSGHPNQHGLAQVVDHLPEVIIGTRVTAQRLTHSSKLSIVLQEVLARELSQGGNGKRGVLLAGERWDRAATWSRSTGRASLGRAPAR
jgi:hypothetical protein